MEIRQTVRVGETPTQKNLEEKVEKIQEGICQMDCLMNSKAQDNDIRKVIVGFLGTMSLRLVRIGV